MPAASSDSPLHQLISLETLVLQSVAIPVLTPSIFRKDSSMRLFRRQLLGWYDAKRRDLPWRKTGDPYRIWVSEIMLQQTRVAAVLEHYRSFLKKFPTVRKLAAASEADVLAAWSGLGYYRRARMLHQASRVVVNDNGGRLPQTALELRLLPGIGRYTANAVASIAFSEPVAVVDGNVERVLCRLSATTLGSKALWAHAQTLLDVNRPGDFNQAMMELGATVCLPGVPACGACPVKAHCASRTLKVKLPKANSNELRLKRVASLLLILSDDKILLQQRPVNETLMPGMWELPRSENRLRGTPLIRLKHSITNTDWTIRVFSPRAIRMQANARWIPLRDAGRLPLTGLTRKILRKLYLLE